MEVVGGGASGGGFLGLFRNVCSLFGFLFGQILVTSFSVVFLLGFLGF